MSRSLPLTSDRPAPAPVFNQGLPKFFLSTSAWKFSFRIRLHNENRIAIFPEKFSIGIVIAIEIRKPEIDCKTNNTGRLPGKNSGCLYCRNPHEHYWPGFFLRPANPSWNFAPPAERLRVSQTPLLQPPLTSPTENCGAGYFIPHPGWSLPPP